MTDSIVTFDDAIPFMPIEKLVAQIEPIQDLHGYDAPWAAGAGANQWDEQWEGGDISAETGINEGNAQMIRSVGYIPVDASKTYYFFCGSISSTNVRARFYDQNKSYIGYSPAGGTFVQVNESFTPPSGAYYMRFAMQPVYGTTYQNDISVNYPATVTTYAPYSNECPISGWTGLSGERCGKNLIDHTQNESGGIDASGNEVSGTTFRRSSNYIPIKPNTSFALWANNNWTVRLYFYDANKNFIPPRKEGGTGGEAIATSPSNAYFARWSVYNAGSAFTNDDIINSQLQLEVGSSATAYEPYITPTTITVSWQTEAGTVYGSNVDVVTGLLTADRAKLVLDENIPSGSNGFRNISVLTNGVRAEYYPYRAVGRANSVVLSDKFRYGSVSDGTPFIVGTSETNQRLYLTLPLEYDTEEKIRAWFASNPSEFVYYLATPQTYQLTPQQVLTLVGQNNVFVDTGDVSVTYQSTSGSTPVRTSLRSPLASYSYNSLKLFGNTFIEHGKG